MRSKTVLAAVTVGIFVAFTGLTPAAEETKPTQDQAKAAKREARAKAKAKAKDKPLEWQIAVMSYTFNRFTLFEAIDKTKKAGATHIETFSWQKLSADHGDLKFEPTLPEDARKAVKKKLADSGVKLTGYYFHEMKDEASSRPVFAFCKDMGIEYIVSEPEAKNLPMLDKLAQEFQVKLAVHNHPKDPKKTDYAYWNPEGVMKALDGCSSWVGCCADNGHWVRSGLDPVESIRKYNGRLVSLHFKDVNKVGADAHDVPYGTGVVDMKGMFGAIQKMGFSGTFAIEYEHNMENNEADVAQCIEYFNKAKTDLKVK